ncbi:hypothetical protein QT994_25425, partial [Microcoleus sp. S13_B4]
YLALYSRSRHRNPGHAICERLFSKPYLGIKRASQLPREFLQELDSVIIAIAENSQLARNARSLLPNAEIVSPQSSWNDIWIQLIEQEQQTQKQNNQQYKQRIQEIELD